MWDHRLQIIYKTSSWHLNGFFPDGMVTLGQQYNTGEKPIVMLYTSYYMPASTGAKNPRAQNWIIGNNRVRCSPDWSVYRCIERYCMTPRQRDDDNNLSGGNRNHLKLGIEPESWLQSHELGL